jgi:hypothetical protein
MYDIILIIIVVFLILFFFYRQAICEFRINQIEWQQKDNMTQLLGEKSPIVLRGIPATTFWTHEDVNLRDCFSQIPVFKELSLKEWLNAGTPDTNCQWMDKEAEQIASVSSMKIWATKWLNPYIIHRFLKWWIYPKYYCWAGSKGLQKTIATWTSIFVTDGEISVSIMPESNEAFLPPVWKDRFPSEFTVKDTPFINDLKYVDIILRPGNCLFMPAHWYIAWLSTSEVIPLVAMIQYHTPVSFITMQLKLTAS